MACCLHGCPCDILLHARASMMHEMPVCPYKWTLWTSPGSGTTRGYGGLSTGAGGVGTGRGNPSPAAILPARSLMSTQRQRHCCSFYAGHLWPSLLLRISWGMPASHALSLKLCVMQEWKLLGAASCADKLDNTQSMRSTPPQ